MDENLISIEELHAAGELTPIFSKVCAELKKVLPAIQVAKEGEDPFSMRIILRDAAANAFREIPANEEMLIKRMAEGRVHELMHGDRRMVEYYHTLRNAVSIVLTEHTRHDHLVI